VRAGSHGRGLHANRVGAVAGHAALNHVDTNFLASGRSWEAVESAPRSDQVRARCREGAGRCRRVGGSTVEGLEPIGIVRRIWAWVKQRWEQPKGTGCLGLLVW
jgi:hypothetical protein